MTHSLYVISAPCDGSDLAQRSCQGLFTSKSGANWVVGNRPAPAGDPTGRLALSFSKSMLGEPFPQFFVVFGACVCVLLQGQPPINQNSVYCCCS